MGQSSFSVVNWDVDWPTQVEISDGNLSLTLSATSEAKSGKKENRALQRVSREI
eukprot:COSAG02_NODE_32328_length_518_cov_0.854415_1_plen_53_part_10